jgi:hypothetical protein
MKMTRRKPKASLWKTEFIAYKVTDKTTGETRLAITRGGSEDDAFKSYVSDMSGRSVALPNVEHLTGEPKKEAIRKWSCDVDDFVKRMNDRRSDFIIEKAPDPFLG